MIRDHGFVIGATRLWKRVWQLYLAHDMVLVIYVAIVGFVAWRFQFDSLVHQFNVARLIDDPFRFAGNFLHGSLGRGGWNCAEANSRVLLDCLFRHQLSAFRADNDTGGLFPEPRRAPSEPDI
jgi:hypothetical protein